MAIKTERHICRSVFFFLPMCLSSGNCAKTLIFIIPQTSALYYNFLLTGRILSPFRNLFPHVIPTYHAKPSTRMADGLSDNRADNVVTTYLGQIIRKATHTCLLPPHHSTHILRHPPPHFASCIKIQNCFRRCIFIHRQLHENRIFSSKHSSGRKYASYGDFSIMHSLSTLYADYKSILFFRPCKRAFFVL